MVNLAYNTFKGVSYIPYNIVQFLFNNEDVWKLIYYTTNDALEQPNLTAQEKANLVWTGEDNQEDFRVFLTPMQENIQPSQSVILRLYIYKTKPINNLRADVLIGMEFLCQSKLGMLKDGRARLDVLWEEIVGSLNNKDVGGIGNLFFALGNGGNPECSQMNTTGNKKDYMGKLTVLGVHQGNIGYDH